MESESSIRNVLGLAHEVRIDFRDSRVIFGTVVSSQDSETFVVRPWGVRSALAFRFDEVARAHSVRHMLWQKERAICAAQGVAFSQPEHAA